MTKCYKFWVPFIIVCLMANFSWAQSNNRKIFRYINLGKYGKLQLGKPFENKGELSIKIDHKAYKLREGIFGGAKSIIIYLDDLQNITMIRFEYGTKGDYYEAVESYSKALGPPQKSEAKATLKKAIWDDGSTHFEYIMENLNKYSILSDNLK